MEWAATMSKVHGFSNLKRHFDDFALVLDHPVSLPTHSCRLLDYDLAKRQLRFHRSC